MRVIDKPVNIRSAPFFEPKLFEMLRSFVVLADTLNVTHAEQISGSTRQTIKRHISRLQNLSGHTLFQVFGKTYSLTDAGHKALSSARALLIDAERWTKGSFVHDYAPQRHIYYKDNNEYIYLEQKGLTDLCISDTPFLRDCLTSWMQRDAKFESLQAVREYAIVFRRAGKSWAVVEVGEKSSAAQWFGETWRRSCIGTRLENLPASDRLSSAVVTGLDKMSDFNSVRLDHICTHFPKSGHAASIPHSYKRLLLYAYFDDGSPALISIAERTHDLRIEGLSENLRTAMPTQWVMSANLGCKLV